MNGKEVHQSGRSTEGLDISTTHAYKIMYRLNEELKAKGYIIVAGRVNRQDFNERLYGAERSEENASL